jgi:hypothetical protein
VANRYCAVNSLAGCIRNSLSVVESTTAGTFDSAYVPNSIATPSSGTEYLQTYDFLATGLVCTRFDYHGGIGGSSGGGIYWMNGSTPVFRILGSTHQCSYWNGSAWVNTGAAFGLTAGVRNVLVMIFNLTAGSFELYVNGALATSGSGWTGGPSQITSFRGGSMRGSTSFFSQIMVADYDLRDAHLMKSPITGDSAVNNAGTGAYTDVNETILSESTAIAMTAAGKRGFTHSAITVPSGLAIFARVLNARARVSGGVVTDGKLGVRSGGANYSSASKAFTSGYESRGHIVELNPDGDVPWSLAAFNSAEDFIEAL